MITAQVQVADVAVRYRCLLPILFANLENRSLKKLPPRLSLPNLPIKRLA